MLTELFTAKENYNELILTFPINQLLNFSMVVWLCSHAVMSLLLQEGECSPRLPILRLKQV